MCVCVCVCVCVYLGSVFTISFPLVAVHSLPLTPLLSIHSKSRMTYGCNKGYYYYYYYYY